MNKEDIEKYLRMLGQELQQRNITGEILHELKLPNNHEALTLVKKYVPEQLLLPRMEYMIDEIFE